MRKDKAVYNWINGFVLLTAVFLFFQDYAGKWNLFKGKDAVSLTSLLMSVVLAHMIKAGRLYLTLYGTEIRWKTYLKVYCKVTPVSVLFPLKTGEFFRMYCYGKQLGNNLKGIIIVLLDRFMDTLALVTMILGVCVVSGGQVSSVMYALILLLMCLLAGYYVFPGMYAFWKHFLMSAKATEKRIALLKFLEASHAVYTEISNVTKGRGIMLYLLSVAAWGIELGSVVLISGHSSVYYSGVISQYLSAALGIGRSDELKQFVFCSVILLIIVYTGIKSGERKKTDKERIEK